MARKAQRKWMAEHSGETGLDSGTESQIGTETGIGTETETETESETEASEVEGVHLVKGVGEEVLTEWRGGRGLEAGRKMEAITGEEAGTEIGTEIGTVIGTETDGTGKRGEAV